MNEEMQKEMEVWHAKWVLGVYSWEENRHEATRKALIGLH